MNAESVALSPQPSDSRNITLKWMTLLAVHFRADLTEAEMRIYCDSLAHEDPERLEVAFQRSLHECEFLPKLKEILERMPYRPSPVKTDAVPASQHYEPIDEGHHLHVWITSEGQRYVRVERKKAG